MGVNRGMSTHLPDRLRSRHCWTPKASSARSRGSRTRSSSATTTSAESLSSASTPAASRSPSGSPRLIEERSGEEIELGAVDITFHRDDAVPGREQPVVHATALDFDLRGMTVILVDDVLYTGRTIRAAIETLFERGRPARVQLAVLVDRGHRELPIRPDYVGKNLPTARSERIQVELAETDGGDRILLVGTPEEKS